MTNPMLTNPSLTAVVCSLEHRAWAALCSSGQELCPLLSSTPVMIFPSNHIFTAVSSPTIHEMLRSPEFQPWSNYSLSHDEVIPLGKDSAMIYYRVMATRINKSFNAICSSVWVLEKNEWKMASHQQTLI